MYSPDTADVMNFMVDSFGNMVYTDWEAGEVILRKKDGELYTLLSGQNDATASTYWIGLDGNNYIFDVNNDKVYKITIGTDGVVRKTLYKSSTAIMVNADTEILKLKNNIVFVTYGNYSNITVDDGYTFETMNIPFESFLSALGRDKKNIGKDSFSLILPDQKAKIFKGIYPNSPTLYGIFRDFLLELKN